MDTCCRSGEALCFYNVMERARQRRKLAVGFKRIADKNPEINPKAKAAVCLTLEATESFVILAKGAY